MPEARLGAARTALVAALAALALRPGLGGSGRLTYHEAIWAQAGREGLAGGGLVVPTLGGRPWLEKPPLATWLIALAGRVAGGVDEASARLPSALAAGGLVVLLARWAARRFGPTIGLTAGLVQATTAWLVMRGRLAEVDVPLALLVSGAVLALDRVRDGGGRGWRGAFFVLLGATALGKGVGFGAALVAATTLLVLLWDRDRATLRALAMPRGWAAAGALALAWPSLILMRYPSALRLWVDHVAGRLSARPGHFAGEPWWLYASGLVWQTLPWTPLALVGAWCSLTRAVRGRGGPDRLLWAWALGPAALVSLATVRNAHYLIYALPPWSVWAALGLERLSLRLRRRGWAPPWVRRGAVVLFAGLGAAYAAGFALLGPWFDRRGLEWAFYERAGRILRPDEPLALLYDPADHLYPSPFGPTPHDLAVRLFYLDRPACWRIGVGALLADPPAPPASPFAVLGRARDVPALARLGHVEELARSPANPARPDREYTLFRVTPEADSLTAGPVPGHAVRR